MQKEGTAANQMHSRNIFKNVLFQKIKIYSYLFFVHNYIYYYNRTLDIHIVLQILFRNTVLLYTKKSILCFPLSIICNTLYTHSLTLDRKVYVHRLYIMVVMFRAHSAIHF